MLEAEVSRLVRESAMAWLDGRGGDLVTQATLTDFEYDGHRLPLMDRQRGIRKPAGMDAALSIRTVYTEPGQSPPYADAEGPDGLIRYKYRGAIRFTRRTERCAAPTSTVSHSSGLSASLRVSISPYIRCGSLLTSRSNCSSRSPWTKASA